MPLDPDAELVASAKNGDARAMEQLYRRHGRAIYAYALRATGAPVQAEDLVQETFVRAYRSIGKFDGRSRFSTWLFAIAINRVRTQLSRQRPEVPLEHAEQVASPETRDSWTRIRLNKALAALPEGYRNVVIMHDVLGMGHAEIAEARGCSVGTSKSQLHKARTKLRTLLGKRPGDGRTACMT